MPLPNLIVIGAMKCGTTSMHDYLSRHPQIAMSANKEVKFFSSDRVWARGVEWYARQFPEGADVRGESSPSYTARAKYPGVPERMRAVVPDAKLLYLVRDPIVRLISHWVQKTSLGTETRALAEAVRDELFLDPSLYWSQISAYLEYYDRSQILVIATEEFASRRPATMRRVFEFLSVDDHFYSSAFDAERHSSSRKRARTSTGAWIARTWIGRGVDALPQRLRWPVRDLLYRPFSRKLERPELDKRSRNYLAERMQDEMHLFREFTGCEFPSWSV